MADKKISQLPNLTGASLAEDDEFVIVDTSADETKSITWSELKEGLDADTGFVRITGDTMTGDLTVPNVVVSGNVDGRDVSADGTKLDGIEAGATADQTKADIDALNVDADTLDGQHGAYYTGYTDTAVANLVDAAPSTLDTLNELAAALGDDPNFATTVTNSVATKLPLSGGAMTGPITTNSTFDGRDVSVDGTKLDGIEAGADVTDTANVTAAGALMDSELASIASVKALDQGVATTDSPTFGGLTVDGTDTEVLITEDSEGSATLRFADTQADPAQSYAIEYNTSSNKANFKINNTQRANFNADGDYMVGPATTNSPFVIYNGNNDATKAGVGLRQTGYIGVARMDDHTMMLNRMGSDGLTMGIRNDGTFVGGLGNSGGELTFHDSTNAEAMRLDSSGRLGIGTNNPSTALDVTGTVTATEFAGDGSGLTNIARKVWESSQGSGSSANHWAKVATYSISSNFDDGTFIYHFMPEELGAGMPAIVAVNVRTNNASGGDSHTLNVELMSKPHATPFSDDSFKLIDNGGSSDIELWVKKNDNNCQISAYEMSAHFEDTGFTITYNQNAAWQASEPNGSGLNIKTVGVKVAGNFTANGTVTATAFAGDGSALTGLPAGYTDADVDTHLNTGTAANGEVLSWTGTDYDWIAASGGGGIAYTRHTSNVTMAANEGVIADTSGGAFTVTLPASPAVGDTVVITDGGDWATTNLTVGRNSSTIEGDAADMTMDIGGAAVQFTYDGTTWQTYAQIGAVAGLGTNRVNFVATAGQTDFSVTYSVGFIDVYLNGIKLIAGDDFTATNGTTVVLTVGATVGDTVDTVAYSTFSVADTYSVAGADSTFVNVTGDTMTGDLVVNGSGIFDGLSVQTADLGTTAGDSVQSLSLRSDTSNTDQMLFTAERTSTGTDWTTAAHRMQRQVDATLMGYMQFGSQSSDLITFGENATERMRIDGDGRVTMPNQPAFFASGSTGWVTTSSGGVLGLNIAAVNIGNGYNTSTYAYTAPVSGLYNVSYLLYMNTNNAATLKKNGSDFIPLSGQGGNTNFLIHHTNSGTSTGSASGVVYLNAGDYIQVGARTGSSIYAYTGHSHFSCYLIG